MALWPTSIATDADLYVAVNSLQTTLSTGLGTGDTSVVLASATGFPTAGAVTIDNEVIFYTNVSGATLTGCTRGADGTTAATHSVGVPVGAAIVAFHHNGLKNEVEAIETDLNARFGRGVSSNAIAIPSGVSLTVNSSAGVAVTAVSNQLVLGATRTVTVTAPTPATTARVWTIPDITADGTFASLTGSQTFTGSKTFSVDTTVNRSTASTPIKFRIENLSNTSGATAIEEIYTAGSSSDDAYVKFSIDGGSSKFHSLGWDLSASAFVLSRSATPGTNNVFSVSDSTGVMTIGSLIASGLNATLNANLAAGSNKITGLAAGSANGDSVRYEQLNPGKILQIVTSSAFTTPATSTSGSYADTGLSASITPSASSSKIICLVMQSCGTTTAGTGVTIRLTRGSTDLGLPGDLYGLYNNAGTEIEHVVPMLFIDSPATTSATTYKTRFSRFTGAGTATVQSNVGSNTGNGSYMILLELGQ